MSIKLPYLAKFGYEALEKVPNGDGSYGSVYKGKLINGTQYVAIKRIHKKVLNNRFKERFQKEASLLYNTHNQYIVKYIDYFDEKDEFFILTEYIEGYSLQTFISQNKLMNDLGTLLKIFLQVLKGILYLHRKKILHLDIKPSNIMLDKNNDVRIVDLGISKTITEVRNKIIGTVKYMSPEQATGQQLSYASDIYSIGVTMIASLLGESPYQNINDNNVVINFIKDIDLIHLNNIKDYMIFQSSKFKRDWSIVPEKYLGYILKRATTKQIANNTTPANKKYLERYSSCEEMYNDLLQLKKAYYG